ncbi:MAG: hypothetical protein CMG00_01185 [Candidatus Marinimicrobia bacterium]|nr:hypothetical protein [Candidatus Neomarinimicrobiota bacterium]
MFNSISYWKTNVLGTINLIEIMSKYRITNLVFSSSATIYTNAKRSFLKEDSKLKHINPY